MKVLITGSNGQLGYELKRTAPEGVELICADIDQLDITSARAINAFFLKHQPDALINAAAYTAVDKAETDRERAYAVNATGPRFLAQACSDAGIPMVQISTDFVFCGSKSQPYKTEEQPKPVNIYGDSKLKGEQAVQEILGNQAAVIRTAWVYSVQGSNFVKTMLRLMQEKDELSVVADQVGTPTWARTLSTGCWQSVDILNDPDKVSSTESLVLHLTDAGIASWYDFAVAIQEEAINLDLLARKIPVQPVPASAYPVPAKRPSYSVLDKQLSYEKLDVKVQHWRESLKSMMSELKDYAYA